MGTGVKKPACIPRYLGRAAALLGRYDEARQQYQEAEKDDKGPESPYF
jgi:hypothetical protein